MVVVFYKKRFRRIGVDQGQGFIEVGSEDELSRKCGRIWRKTFVFSDAAPAGAEGSTCNRIATTCNHPSPLS
jgi:hypothetical protein